MSAPRQYTLIVHNTYTVIDVDPEDDYDIIVVSDSDSDSDSDGGNGSQHVVTDSGDNGHDALPQAGSVSEGENAPWSLTPPPAAGPVAPTGEAPPTPLTKSDDEELALVEDTGMEPFLQGAIANVRLAYQERIAQLAETLELSLAASVEDATRHDVFRGPTPPPGSPQARLRAEILDLATRAPRRMYEYELRRLREMEEEEVQRWLWRNGFKRLE